MDAGGATMQGVSVVTTTWNERETIRELIGRVKTTLQCVQHEVIVIDDSSTDGTLQAAESLADIALAKPREGQTKGLLFGAKLAKFPTIITIDADLENPPELIATLVEKLGAYDVVVASRRKLPRFSEHWAAKTLGKIVGVSDFYSNFRAYRRETIVDADLLGGETFGGELLILAKKHGFRVGELMYDAPSRRCKPRIGGSLKANLRILVASLKCWFMYYS
ncbi:MAG: glycosyltransferase [Nitrososphaerota archaeon]|jgi:dolichol-phosphate mannosyltransferase|nr:glycosyltransferase [Nitrososphaerota archaeon]